MTTRPRYPIIYVRGYAMTKTEIAETTSTPYMGLEYGSTKSRQARNGAVRKVFFESPIVRLMKPGYRDIYQDGLQVETGSIAAGSIIIHRYGDVADPDFGTGKVPTVEQAAQRRASWSTRCSPMPRRTTASRWRASIRRASSSCGT